MSRSSASWRLAARTPAAIPFANNYAGLSSNRGYQFKFFCQKCGNGCQSTFQANKPGTAATAAQAAKIQVIEKAHGGKFCPECVFRRQTYGLMLNRSPSTPMASRVVRSATIVAGASSV